MTKGEIILIPNLLGDSNPKDVLPQSLIENINTIKYFLVEDIRTTRRFLKKLDKSIVIDDLHFEVVDKHTDASKVQEYIQPIFKGNNIGVVSEAGLPCIADPGSIIVDFAHKNNIKVKPIVGPSSIILALITSGMNGQNFAFNGYLPIDNNEKKKKLIQLENRSRNEKQSQIFMETPFRNRAIVDFMLKTLNPNTKLCIASNITLENEFIKTYTIKKWKSFIPDIHKNPTIFIIEAF